MTAERFQDIGPTERASLGATFARMGAALLRPEMRKWRGRIFAAAFVTLVAKGLAVIAPVWLGEGINRAVAANADGGLQAGDGMSVAAPFLLFICLFGLARLLSNALPQVRDGFFVRVTQDAVRLTAVDAFRHAQLQDLQFHLTRRAGAINRIIERGAGAIEFLLRFLAFNIGPTLIELGLAASVIATLYSLKIALTVVVTIALYAIATGLITEWRSAQRRRMNDADTELRAIATDTLSNFETVKAFAAEEREARRYDGAMSRYIDRYVRVIQSLSLLNVVQEAIMTGGLFAAVVMAALGVAEGSMKAGDVTAVILMLTNIYRPLNILGFAWREIRQGTVDIEKLYGLMDAAPKVLDRDDALELTSPRGAIAFENVSFRHEGRAQGLDDVTFEIPPGAFVGLAGPSGAGKSTILRLLFRFHDPESGRVTIDGEDVRNIRQASLRHAFGLVPQEVVLFNDTLRFNLAYAKRDASDEEILQAAERAQLGAFIRSLPLGLETRVGERGLKLSGGEKQRVGVARAILLDPAVLILDEATSSLDSETEREVQSALAAAAAGRTTIAVAHRLSTIAHADRILVLDQGRIAESGTHTELLANGGLYASLWRQQANLADAAPSLPESEDEGSPALQRI
ncbi:MAG: ATP-binding cassette domain-containing protein [Alphaproteobacteria bacterium]|nr:ATP-binding cassette domain-containing protein [Alphaproteobacteria bacterium]